MAPSSTVIIGAADRLAALKAAAGVDATALTFSDTDVLAALDAIVRHRPAQVILERFFATTPRGASLITRIKADPMLARTEIRILAHDGSYERTLRRRDVPGPPGPLTSPPASAAPASGTPSSASAPAPPAASLDWRGTRRAPRVRVRPGVEIQIDGHPAVLVDLSTIGAQVILSRALRPDQKVRVALPQDQDQARFSASVAWVRFEVPQGRGHYRAGLEFRDGDPMLIEAFLARHRQR